MAIVLVTPYEQDPHQLAVYHSLAVCTSVGDSRQECRVTDSHKCLSHFASEAPGMFAGDFKVAGVNGNQRVAKIVSPPQCDSLASHARSYFG